MKNVAPAVAASGRAGATRITPSAPTPRCRSHSAATSEGERSRRSPRSSTRTKSFPVPWYFATRRSSMREVFSDLVDVARGALLAGLEPPDPRIATEPGQLAAGQGPGPPHRPVHGFLEGDPAGH